MDIGTGSGCLAVTLAAELPGARLVGTDTSRSALGVALATARALGGEGQIAWRHGSLTGGVETPVDLIVTNPPYVREDERDSLAPEVRDYEPASALFAGPAGLDVIRALLPAAADVLRAGGAVVMEIGAGQAEAVGMMAAAHEAMVLDRIVPDLAGIPRVAVITRR
jgi:release factor glutamine methyltransferase